MDKERLKALIKKHEGRRDKVYRDSAGVLTIGYGHNLEEKPLTVDVLELILEHDLEDAIKDSKALLPYLGELTPERQEVIVEMMYNLGAARLMGFKWMLAALADRDYKRASDEMLNSRWAAQVGIRAECLAQKMRGDAVK